MNDHRNYSNNNQEDEYEDDFEASIKYSTYENDFEEVNTTHNDSLYSVDFEQLSVKESPLNKSFITKEQNSAGSLYSNDNFEQASVKKTPNKSKNKVQNSNSLYSDDDFESDSNLITKEIKNHSSNVINLNSTTVKPVRPVTASNINATIRKPIVNNNNSTTIITKVDIIRSRSDSDIRPLTSSTNVTINKIQHNKQHQSTKSPKRNTTHTYHNNTNNDNTTKNNLKFKLNSLPPWCFPSRTIPKDLADHLFGVNNKESYVKISLFCKHNKRFADCKEVLCADANEKYKWLNLIRHKGKLAYDLVCEADRYWRKKLHESLEIEIEELIISQSEQLSALNKSFRRESQRQMKLLKQGVAFYESVEPLVIKGEIDPLELYRSTGWTAEHYNYFKKKLQLEMHQAEKMLKVTLDKQNHAHIKEVEVLKKSIQTPIQYLDRIFDSRIEAIHIAISRVDHTFEHSIMLAGSFGYGILNGNTSSKIPQYASELRVIAESERHQRNSKHLFDCLKNSLKAIADICSDVRLMYKEDRNNINIKEHIKNSTGNTSPKNIISTTKKSSHNKSKKKHNVKKRHSAETVATNHYSDDIYDDYQSNGINKDTVQYTSEITTAITANSSIGTSLEVTEEHIGTISRSITIGMNEDEFDDDDDYNNNNLHHITNKTLQEGGITDETAVAAIVSNLKVSHNEIKKQTKAAYSDPLGLPILNLKQTQRNDCILLNELMFRNNIPLSYNANDSNNKHVLLSPIERKKLLQSLDSSDDSNKMDISVTNMKDHSTLFEGTGRMMGPSKQSIAAFSPIKQQPQQYVIANKSKHVMIKCFECHKLLLEHHVKYIPNVIEKDAVAFMKAKSNMQSTEKIYANHTKKDSAIEGIETKEKQTISLHKRNKPCFCSWECCKTYARGYCKSYRLYHTLLLIDIAAGYHVLEKENNKEF